MKYNLFDLIKITKQNNSKDMVRFSTSGLESLWLTVENILRVGGGGHHPNMKTVYKISDSVLCSILSTLNQRLSKPDIENLTVSLRKTLLLIPY